MSLPLLARVHGGDVYHTGITTESICNYRVGCDVCRVYVRAAAGRLPTRAGDHQYAGQEDAGAEMAEICDECFSSCPIRLI